MDEFEMSVYIGELEETIDRQRQRIAEQSARLVKQAQEIENEKQELMKPESICRNISDNDLDALIALAIAERNSRRDAKAQAYIKELVDVMERAADDGFDITINGEHFEDHDITIS